MNFNIVFALFSILLLSIRADDGDDDRVINGKKMHFIKQRTSWYGAQAKCAERGLTLLAIETEEEQNLVKDEVAKEGGDFWVGLYRQYEKENEPFWHWISTGKELPYEAWCGNEGKGGDEFCGLVSHGSRGCWQDWGCFTTTTGYACQEKVGGRSGGGGFDFIGFLMGIVKKVKGFLNNLG